MRFMAEVILQIMNKLMISSGLRIFMRGSTNDDFLKFRRIIQKISQISLTQHSTGLSLGNQVDGLPSARHNTEALWDVQGVFGPAPIDKLDQNKIENV